MITIDSDLIHISQIPKLFPNRPNLQTVYRWVRVGARGKKLEATRFGKHIYTTREALERFAEPLNTRAPEASCEQRGRRQQSKALAKARLAKAGV